MRGEGRGAQTRIKSVAQYQTSKLRQHCEDASLPFSFLLNVTGTEQQQINTTVARTTRNFVSDLVAAPVYNWAPGREE